MNSKVIHRKGDSPSIEVLPRGIVAPLTSFEFYKYGSGGHFDGGAYNELGEICWAGYQTKAMYENRPSVIGKPSAHISGTHLFCGMLQNEHFGHFMAESITRLWAVKLLSGSIDSMVFYKRVPQVGLSNFVMSALSELVPGVPVTIVNQVTSFDVLFVPNQIGEAANGFSYGHPAMRHLVEGIRRERLVRDVKKVYVSRSNLRGGEGGIIMENFIEENMKNSGYEVIYPEAISFRDQLDIYSSADYLVFSEGSALHAFSLMAREGQKVFILWRRKVAAGFERQIKSFGDVVVLGDPCIKRMWVPGGQMVKAHAEINFDHLRRQLLDAGFINDLPWIYPVDQDIGEFVVRMGELNGVPYESFEV